MMKNKSEIVTLMQYEAKRTYEFVNKIYLYISCAILTCKNA